MKRSAQAPWPMHERVELSQDSWVVKQAGRIPVRGWEALVLLFAER